MSKEILTAIATLEKTLLKRLDGVDKRLDNLESDVKEIKRKVNKLYEFTQLDLANHDFRQPVKTAARR